MESALAQSGAKIAEEECPSRATEKQWVPYRPKPERLALTSSQSHRHERTAQRAVEQAVSARPVGIVEPTRGFAARQGCQGMPRELGSGLYGVAVRYATHRTRRGRGSVG